MSVLLYLFGRYFWCPTTPNSDSSPPKFELKAKNRLQKHPKLHDDRSKERERERYCKDLLDIFRAQTCLTLVENDENKQREKAPNDVATEQENQRPPTPKHIEFSSQLSIIPDENENTSIYSSDDTKMPIPWRRAKTPVYAIGQLEKAFHEHVIGCEAADKLAEQYRATLSPPPRTPTPLAFDITQKPPRKTLRKIKCQQSLRDLVKSYPSTPTSDCETLVGSDANSSPPDSPVHKHVDVDHDSDFSLFDSYSKHEIERALSPESTGDADVGFQICMDLLTSKLATALVKQHPVDHAEKASELQILLMIEAYESIKNHLQQAEDHVTPAEEALEYWIEALYRIYDQTRTKANPKIEEREDWPLPASGIVNETILENEAGWSPQRLSTFTSSSSRDADDETGSTERPTLRHYAGTHS